MKGDRYSWHQCWHHDAWIGVDDLSGLATGIYWKIILRMYIRRAALPDDDAALARLFNETLKNYRRAKAELLSAGRIVIDDENGILFDERAMRELVAAARFSERQQKRAQRPRRAPAKAAPANVVTLHEVGSNSPTKSAPTPPRSRLQLGGRPEQNQRDNLSRNGANQNQSQKTESRTPKSSATRAASPPDGGGAHDKQQQRREALKALREIKQRKGFDETERDEPAAPADRTARRRKA